MSIKYEYDICDSNKNIFSSGSIGLNATVNHTPDASLGDDAIEEDSRAMPRGRLNSTSRNDQAPVFLPNGSNDRCDRRNCNSDCE